METCKGVPPLTPLYCSLLMLERLEKIENETFPTFQLPTLSVRIYDTYNYKYFYIDKPKTADYYIGGLDNGCFWTHLSYLTEK